MAHLITCGDATNCTWTDLSIPTVSSVPNTGRILFDSSDRGLDEEEYTCLIVMLLDSRK